MIMLSLCYRPVLLSPPPAPEGTPHDPTSATETLPEGIIPQTSPRTTEYHAKALDILSLLPPEHRRLAIWQASRNKCTRLGAPLPNGTVDEFFPRNGTDLELVQYFFSKGIICLGATYANAIEDLKVEVFLIKRSGFDSSPNRGWSLPKKSRIISMEDVIAIPTTNAPLQMMCSPEVSNPSCSLPTD